MARYAGHGEVDYQPGDTIELLDRRFMLTDAGWKRVSRIDDSLQSLTPREARLFRLAKEAAK